MPALPIALASYERMAAYLPNLRLRNLYPEKTPANATSVILLPRPGLKASYMLATGPVVGVFSEPGVFGGQSLAVSGGIVYLGATAIGAAVPGSCVRFAASQTEAVFTTGGLLYRTDGTSVIGPSFPESGAVSVAILDSRFIAVARNSQKFYWSNILDGTTWDGLSFASAESRPDNLLDVMVVGDELWLLGQRSTEVWQPTGDLDLPFARVEARLYPKGVIATGAAIEADNTLFWTGNDGIVYRGGPVPLRVSDHGIEAQIALSLDSVAMFSFTWTGHTFVVLKLAAKTYLFDVETREWFEASTLNRAGWRASCACMVGALPLLGDEIDGTIWSLDDTTLTDGSDVIERRFTAVVPDPAILDNIRLDAQGGIGSEPDGNPIVIEMAMSRDGGQTFGNWRQAELGARGSYRARAVWRRCGTFDMPGGVLDFRMTDAAPFSVEAIRANDPLSGRGR